MTLSKVSAARAATYALLAITLATACGQKSEGSESVTIHRDLTVNGGLPAKEWTDPKGHVWVRSSDTPVQVLTADEAEAYFADLAKQQVSDVEKGAAEPDYATMDLETIAAMMRVKTVIQGYEYVSEPDLEMAAAIKKGFIPTPKDPDPGAAPQSPGDMPDPKDLIGQNVIGYDSRTNVRANTTWPNTTQLVLSNTVTFTDTKCSASLVGNSTAVTAGHCLWTTSGALTGNWYWAPGEDRQDATRYIFNPHHASTWTLPMTGSHRVNGCYFAYTAQTYDGSIQRDWAVIEFSQAWWSGTGVPCGEALPFDDQPGYAMGHLGLAAYDAGTIGSSVLYVMGYPSDTEPCPGGTCYPASIWGAAGTSEDVNQHAIDYQIDASFGQSGTGVYTGSYYVVGMHVGWSSGSFPTYHERNYARRVTSDVFAAMLDHSAL